MLAFKAKICYAAIKMYIFRIKSGEMQVVPGAMGKEKRHQSVYQINSVHFCGMDGI